MDVAPVSAWQSFWAHAGQYGPRIDGGYPFALANLHKEDSVSDPLTEAMEPVVAQVDALAEAKLQAANIVAEGGWCAPKDFKHPIMPERDPDSPAHDAEVVASPEAKFQALRGPFKAVLTNVDKDTFNLVLGGATPPKVVCLCGSTKFKKQFEKANSHYTRQGWIVLAPGVFGHADGIELSEEEKAALDKLHFAKIDATNLVVVVTDHTGYIGDSTKAEILYALRQGKTVQLEQKWD